MPEEPFPAMPLRSFLKRLFSGRLFWTMLAACIFIGIILPRSLALLPGLLGLMFYGASVIRKKDTLLFRSPAWLYPVVILLLGFLSALWAIDPAIVIERSAKLTGVLLPGTLLILLALSIPAQHTRKDSLKKDSFTQPILTKHAAYSLGIALLASALVLNSEFLLDYPLYKLSRGLQPQTHVDNHEFNRCIVALTVMMFPVITLITHRAGKYSKIFAVAVLAAYIPLCLQTASQSAQLAFIAGALFFWGFPYRKQKAFYGLAALLIAACAAFPFLSIWAFENYALAIDEVPILHQASAANRLEIWDYISRYMLDSPLTGYGIEATRAVKEFDSGEIFQKGKTILHPHNAFIQIWIEFGLIGVTIFSALLAHLFHKIAALPTAAARKACLPGVMCALSVSLTGYGLWQGWWVGLLVLLSAVTVIAAKATQAESLK